MAHKLTEKQRRFVEAYSGPAAGNAAEAAKMAGYRAKNAHGYAVAGNDLLTNPDIRVAIQELSEQTRRASIADVTECKEILTKLARGEEIEPKDRIAAVDKLLKCSGAYLERQEVTVTAASVQFVYPDNGRVPPPE
jgi:phage terminase small subunit